MMKEPVSILYVDDEEILRTLVKDQLMGEGFSVETADDGDTALEHLENRTYDMILLDIRMPRLSGIEVLKILKKRKVASRVIVLTAVSDLAVAIEAVKNGANDYLTKPYELTTLVSAINRVMAR
jgi:DNA-binding NtrC family response regulator